MYPETKRVANSFLPVSEIFKYLVVSREGLTLLVAIADVTWI